MIALRKSKQRKRPGVPRCCKCCKSGWKRSPLFPLHGWAPTGWVISIMMIMISTKINDITAGHKVDVFSSDVIIIMMIIISTKMIGITPTTTKISTPPPLF